jgi:hypothetical protein
MPDRGLRTTYLERLHDALTLSDRERDAAVEEIHAHVELAADEMVGRGIPREAAVRQVLERLGAPDRLARDITAAHRRPLDLATAAGVAIRVTAVTAFKAFVLAWTGVALLALVLGLAVAGIRRLAGAQFLQLDWSPVLDGMIPAAVGALVAYGIGRALVMPIAVAAHRSAAEARVPVIAVGIAVATAVALVGVEAQWTIATALAMASLPAWYVLGVMRPGLLPLHALRGPSFVLPMIIFLVGVPLLLVAVGGQATSMQSGEGEPYDPNVAYAAVGPFVDIERPPLEMTGGSESTGPWTGPGPIRIERSGRFVAGRAGSWTDIRLEVWQGPVDTLDGNALDPQASAPLITAPMVITGSRVQGWLELLPQPGPSSYYVAVTGVTADGERVQLAWPGVEIWQWRGTTLQFFEALVR